MVTPGRRAICWKSVSSELISFVEEIVSLVDRGNGVDGMYLDSCKVFDFIP